MVWCPSDLRPKSLSVWLCLALNKNLTSFCYKRGVRGGSPDTAVAGSLIGETGPGSATLIMSFARTSVRRLSLLNQLYVLVIASHPGFFLPMFFAISFHDHFSPRRCVMRATAVYGDKSLNAPLERRSMYVGPEMEPDAVRWPGQKNVRPKPSNLGPAHHHTSTKLHTTLSSLLCGTTRMG